MKFTEKCACGGSISVPMPPNAPGEWGTWAMAQLKEWRESHLHEMPAPTEEPPFIHESGSSHERHGDYYGAEDRVVFGFQRNEVR